MRNRINLIAMTTLLFFQSFSMAFGEQTKLKTYGYFDTEVEASFESAKRDQWTFDQHHFNLLAIYTLDNRFRVFTELDWEHGQAFSVTDTSNSSGSMYLANAFLEYKYNDALRLMVGKFLSPFGLYNVRHDATPTFLFTALPHVIYGHHELSEGIEGRYFARFSTGIQMLGSTYYQDWRLAYYAYVSNGRGAEPGSVDDNTNKALGFRGVITPAETGINIGFSYYTERNGLSYDARQTTVGFDLEFDIKSWHGEAELILPVIEELDINNVPTNTFVRPLGAYGLLAYTISERYTPFARYEYTDHNRDAVSETHDKIVFGLNWAVTHKVYLKSEYHLHNPSHAHDNYQMILSSVAVAF